MWSSVVVVLFVNAPSVSAQSDEDDETPAGLVATYQSVSRDKTVSRIDRSLSFHWKNQSPDQRIPAGPFKARWKGQLLVRQNDRYMFHVFVSGKVTIRIDGERALAVESSEAGWSSGETLDLTVGERDLVVEFESHDTSDARMSVFWSSETFELEPLPGYLLFRDGSDEKLTLLERGRQLYQRHGCGQCHQRSNDLPTTAGPDLMRLDMDAEWLRSFLKRSGDGSVPKNPPKHSKQVE